MTAIVLTPDQYATILSRIDDLEKKVDDLERRNARPTIDPLLTVEETAKQLKVSTKTVYRRIQERKLQAVLVSSKSYGIRQSTINQYLART